MIVRRGTLRGTAVLVLLLVGVLTIAESVKLRKPRRMLANPTGQQSRVGPVIIRVMHTEKMHKYNAEDDRARGGCANRDCRSTRDKFNFGVNGAMPERDNFLSDEESLRYVVHPEKYEHFVLRKSAAGQHASRYRRASALSSNASDRTTASGVPEDKSKGNFTLYRVPLYRAEYVPPSLQDLARSLGNASRATRSLAATADRSSRGNDYYAQRKAVMERYYARQREIDARYADRADLTPRSEDRENEVSRRRRPATSDATSFDLVPPSEAPTARNATPHSPHRPSARIDQVPTDQPNGRRNVVAPELDLGSPGSGTVDLSQARSSGNVERNALDHFVTPTPCTNLSSSGTFAPKARSEQNAKDHETERGSENSDHTSVDNDNTEGNLRWGRCEGKIVYRHNLLLGLTGPSNLDALFEVSIQGPVCITCVEASRYNETRATVALDSGGRGHGYAKLKLLGYENEGFSYIIKVWGVKKTGQACDNVD